MIIRFASNDLFHAPGVIRWCRALNKERSKKLRAIAKNVLMAYKPEYLSDEQFADIVKILLDPNTDIAELTNEAEGYVTIELR